jgi:MFS family permease
VRTYREIFSVAEFRALFAGNAASIAGMTMQALALSSLVYARTGSAFLSALAYLGGFLPQAIGAATLLSLADRVRPRRFLVLSAGVRAVIAFVLAEAGLPVWALLTLIMAAGVFTALDGAVRSAVLVDVLPRDGYVLGRSVLNLSVGAMQIAGFGIAGVLLNTVGPRPTLLASCALAVVTAVVTRCTLSARPSRTSGSGTVAATVRGNRILLGRRLTRNLLLAMWVPNGLIIGAEALYIPYAGKGAGAMFVAAACGMLIGDVVIGRWVAASTRVRLITPLRVLLALPYLAFSLHPELWAASAIVLVASFGFSGSLGLQDRFVTAVPESIRGQALGLAGTGMTTAQAVAALLTGMLADVLSPGSTMAIAAITSLAVTVMLIPGLRVQPRQGTDAPSAPARS